MCGRLQYRRVKPRQRQAVRAALQAIALCAADPFDWDGAIRAARRNWTDWRLDAPGAFRFLRQHGFIRRVEPYEHGRRALFELTEQAIRWLDWAGFDWSMRRTS